MRSILGWTAGSLLLTVTAWPALVRAWPQLAQSRRRKIFWVAVVVTHLAFVLAHMAGRARVGALLSVVDLGLTAWFVAALGTSLLRLALVAPMFVARRWRRVARNEPVIDAGRRQFLGFSLVPLGAASTGLTGAAARLTDFELRHEEFRIKGLPPALDGFKIGQITDVHVGEFIDVEHLGRAVTALNDAGVDVQVMTGDLIDDLEQLDPTLEAMGRCTAQHGMVCILGNHEKWRGEDVVVAAYRRHAEHGRLHLLVNEATLLQHGGATLRVVGVDYPMGKGGNHRLSRDERVRKMESSADKAFANVAATETVLCLTHHPDFFPIACRRGAHLTLAGHTHGGQIGLLKRVPLFSFAFEHMLGRYQREGAHLYVGAGTGHWFPYRVGMPTEVTVLTSRRLTSLKCLTSRVLETPAVARGDAGPICAGGTRRAPDDRQVLLVSLVLGRRRSRSHRWARAPGLMP